MTLYRWLQTPGLNSNSDATINWAEGQAPSTVNDSARAMMAAVAKYRDDIAGAIVTGATSTIYTISSYEVFDTLAHLNGQVIAFTPHVTSGAPPVTLNVDSLGAKPLRSAPNVEIPAGTLVQGTPYVATYNNSDGAFYLHGFYGASPYLIPLGSMIDYTGTTAPNSNFVLPFGQAISRTTYAALFSMVGTTFGTGDGSTTFNVPDLRGRVAIGKDDMGGSAASRITSVAAGFDGTSLGAAGGAQTETLTLAQLPTGITAVTPAAITVNFGANVPRTAGVISGNDYNNGSGPLGPNFPTSASGGVGDWNGISSASTSGAVTVTSNNTSGSAHVNVQPAIVLNKILRVI